jgi:hypothetical protein
MRQFRAPSSGLDKSFAAQFWAGYITNMSGFDLRQAHLKSYADYYNSVRTHRSLKTRMRRSLAKFSESEVSNHTPSLADFTTTTPELEFSVHTTPTRPTITQTLRSTSCCPA